MCGVNNRQIQSKNVLLVNAQINMTRWYTVENMAKLLKSECIGQKKIRSFLYNKKRGC